MEKLPELPEKIWLLIEKIPFEELSEEQKKLVAKYLSEESYLQLSFASRTLQEQLQEDKKNPVPERLNQRFKESLQSRKKNYSIPLWQAAAIFVVMAAGWLLSFLIQTESRIVMQTIHDTVYVAQTVPSPVLQRDTVYIYKERAARQNEKKQNRGISNRIQESRETTNPVATVDAGIRVIAGEELINKLQQGKGISMAEDSLYKRIGYAGI